MVSLDEDDDEDEDEEDVDQSIRDAADGCLCCVFAGGAGNI